MSRRKPKGKRPTESYRGKSEEARARQLENLKPGKGAEPGNTRAFKHGAFSRVDPARVDAQVQRLVALLEGDPPLRASDGGLPQHDHLALELLARCLVRLGDVSHYLSLHGILDPATGRPRPAVALEGELRREAATLAVQLGMTPLSRARLGLEVAEAGALMTGQGQGRPDQFAVFDTDPGVMAARRELVRAAGRAREAELNAAQVDVDAAPVDVDPPPPGDDPPSPGGVEDA